MPCAQATSRLFSWEEWFRHVGLVGVDTSVGQRFRDYGLAVQAAAAGQGVVLAGWPALQDTLEAGLLVCPFEDNIVGTDIGSDLVTTHEVRGLSEVMAFVDWLLNVASHVPPLR